MAEFPDQSKVDVLPSDAKPSTDSVRGAIESAFEQSSGPPDGTPAPSQGGGASDAPGAAPESTPAGRPRTPDGKFAAKAAPAPLEIPKFGETPKPAEGEQPPAESADPSAKAPASWKPEKAALWDKIADPDARAYIHEREKQLHEGFQRAAQVREVAESILGEFVPYQEILQQENATPATAIRALLQTAYALRTSPPEYKKALFLQLAQQYGVDFSQELNPEVARAQGEAAQLRMQEMERSARVSTAEEQAVRQQIDAFAANHEFFPQVRNVMGRLIDSGVAPDLETAYQQAVSIVPEVAREMEARKVAAAQAQQTEQARQRAARSLQGGAAPGAGAMPSGGAPAEPESIREALERAWQSATG
jgi:hypothetical protein